MAACDYRLCDVCENKVFYDANLNYRQDISVDGEIRNGGEMISHTSLDRLGDWAVICTECAKTHKTVVIEIE